MVVVVVVVVEAAAQVAVALGKCAVGWMGLGGGDAMAVWFGGRGVVLGYGCGGCGDGHGGCVAGGLLTT